MNSVEKRDYIHNYLFRLVDSELEEVYSKVRSAVERDIALTQAQSEELEERVLKHKSGESKSYSWSEVKEGLNQ